MPASELPPRTEGNVYFETGTASFRYLGDPEKTAAAFRDSAFTAGDVGWVDEDGYLFISGRAADVIVSAGVNVYPAVIEAALDGVPGVADLCVVSGPDEERGEVPVAVVVVAPGHDPATVIAALRARADDQIAAYERPRDTRSRGTNSPVTRPASCCAVACGTRSGETRRPSR